MSCIQVLIGLMLLTACVASPPNVHTRSHHVHSKERIEDAFESHAKQSNNFEPDDHELDHEAILGSRHKAQEFDGLSPEESKQRLRKLVDAMDTNHDGYVDKHELTHWVLNNFQSLAIEEGEDRLEEEDLDGDGLVTFEEHLKGSFDYEDYAKVGNFASCFQLAN